MPATRCTCLREGDLRLMIQDPLCPAGPRHRWDEEQQLEKEVGEILG